MTEETSRVVRLKPETLARLVEMFPKLHPSDAINDLLDMVHSEPTQFDLYKYAVGDGWVEDLSDPAHPRYYK